MSSADAMHIRHRFKRHMAGRSGSLSSPISPETHQEERSTSISEAIADAAAATTAAMESLRSFSPELFSPPPTPPPPPSPPPPPPQSSSQPAPSQPQVTAIQPEPSQQPVVAHPVPVKSNPVLVHVADYVSPDCVDSSSSSSSSSEKHEHHIPVGLPRCAVEDERSYLLQESSDEELHLVQVAETDFTEKTDESDECDEQISHLYTSRCEGLYARAELRDRCESSDNEDHNEDETEVLSDVGENNPIDTTKNSAVTTSKSDGQINKLWRRRPGGKTEASTSIRTSSRKKSQSHSCCLI